MTPDATTSTRVDELEQRLRDMEDAERLARCGSWALGADGLYRWSSGMYELFGMPHGSEIPQPEVFARNIHPDDQARVRDAFLANWAGVPTIDFDYRIVLPAGAVRYLRVNATLRHRPDGVACIVGTTQDVTPEHTALAELRLKELAVESAINAIGISGLDGRLTYANPSLVRLWEFDRVADVLGRPIAGFWADPDEVSAVRAALARDGRWNGEMRARTMRGNLRLMLASVSVVRDEHQRPVANLGSFQDITERHLAEAEIQRSLEEKDALLKELHHRVKNNLQVISSLLRMEASRAPEPANRSILGAMQYRIASMAFVHELLYRSDNVAHVDLAAYLDRLVRFLFTSIAPAGRQVDLDVRCEPVQVDMDQAVPCGLVVTELVSNAFKHAFTTQAHGCVTVTLSSVTPDVIELVVRDDGIGLPATVHEQTFESLGLQLVGDLVRQLRGTLTIGAAPGASFTLRFGRRHGTPTEATH